MPAGASTVSDDFMLQEDVKLMVGTGLDAYRLSISWSRLIPTLYNTPKIIRDFINYAEVCFREFGDRVLYWNTMNEPNVFTIGGYDQETTPPIRYSPPFCQKYNSSRVHHILLSHSSVVRLYRRKYKIILPANDTDEDWAATQRAHDFFIIESLQDALKQLYLIDAIDENGAITSIGQKMAELPLEPSLSRTLMEANDYGCIPKALTVAAMLSAETTLLPGWRSTDTKEFITSRCDKSGILACDSQGQATQDPGAPLPPLGPCHHTPPMNGSGPTPPSKKQQKEFDSFVLPPPDKKGIKPVQSPGPFLLGTFPRYVSPREEILSEPLTQQEIDALGMEKEKLYLLCYLDRDGLTHNMLDNIHAHWKRKRVCKIKCKGVCRVDMDNVCRQLEEKTGGKIIYRRGVYPKLVKRVPEGLTLQQVTEMRKKGRELIPICKLGKNVREAFEECELVRINCQGLNKSDYRKIGAKLRDLVPCVLLSYLCGEGKIGSRLYQIPQIIQRGPMNKITRY
ncbi:hypothetical protein AHAS_Ahas14G0192900 [Arachis hypogaea]